MSLSNETILPCDRSQRGRGVRSNRFISCLAAAGYVDAYRACHDDPGWTCRTALPHGEVASARLDYVWCRGYRDDAVRSATITGAPVRTTHSAVLVEVESSLLLAERIDRHSRSLPDMRNASEEQRDQCVASMHRWASSCGIDEVLESADRAGVETATAALIAAAHRACAALPRTGRKPRMSLERLALAERCRRLLRLRTFLLQHDHANPRQLHPLMAACGLDLEPVYRDLGCVVGDAAEWRRAVSLRLNDVRRLEHAAVRKMKPVEEHDSWSKNPAAFVHRMLNGDRAQDLVAIVDPADGCLKADAVGGEAHPA